MSHELASAAIDLIEPQICGAMEAAGKRPFLVGMCGAQGSGKSTICAGLRTRLEARRLRVALLALDDLYLPRADRERLAVEVHPLLRTRGVPGTHDVAMGAAVIGALGGEGMVRLPRFAKEDDDRIPESRWTEVSAPVDIILFEGWCVGAVPQDEAALVEPVNALERDEDRDGTWRRWVNARLAADYQRLFASIDYLILLRAPGFGVVSAWRKEQENRLRDSLPGEAKDFTAIMDDRGVDRFIQHYQRITQHMLTEMTGRADLCLLLDAQRRPSLRGAEKV